MPAIEIKNFPGNYEYWHERLDPANQDWPVMGIIFESFENFLALKFSGRTGFLQKVF